jgi:signal transduction histidine kinase
VTTSQKRETKTGTRLSRGILSRTALLALAVISFTLGLFILLIIPNQRATLIEGLKSKAEVIATSIEQVTVTSIVVEDYSSVVDHAIKVVNDRPSVLYLVITRKDGFSLVHTAHSWQRRTLEGFWNPPDRSVPLSLFTNSDLLDGEEVHHYAHPIHYSGIDWGWIHIGLSIRKYNSDLRSMYLQTIFIAAICMVAGLVLSLFFARRLSRPILQLNEMADRVAQGDLDARAEIYTGDELQALADAFNKMTESLQKARDELEIRVEDRTADLQKSNALLKREISERRKSEQERAHLEDRLQHSQKMEAVGQLTAGIAHNFNNMLVVVMGNMELALMDAPAAIKPPMERAIGACQRAADMIRELMLFSRKESMETSVIEIEPVVSEAVEICRKTFNRKIEFEFEPSQDMPPIMGDAVQIQQVLLNLLINARDAMESQTPADGDMEIHISMELYDLGSENLLSRPHILPGHYVRVEVEDTGPGMEGKVQERIFEPFFTTKDVGQGTGLGLATVYGIVQQHRGWIDVESEIGKGTKFILYLPAAEQAELLRESLDDVDDIPGGNETILVIDDEDEIRQMLSKMLARQGYKVLEAPDGAQGLEVIRQNKKDIGLVLLDLSMPIMSGEQVLQELSVASPEIRVVIITGYLGDRTEHEGALATVRKPFRRKELLQTARAVLDN